MTDAMTAAYDGTTMENQHQHVWVGSSYMQLNQTVTASDGTTTADEYLGSQIMDVYALLPEFYDEESMVGVEVNFSTHLPKDHVAKDEWLASWISYSSTEEVETVDSTGASTWVTETYHYGLACAANAAEGVAEAMEFDGDPSYEANMQKTLQEHIDEYHGTADSAARRMLKGKRRKGKKSGRLGKRKGARKGTYKKRQRFNLRQKRAAKARVEKHEKAGRMAKRRDGERRKLADGTTTTTSADGTTTTDTSSFADYCWNEDNTACTYKEVTHADICDPSVNTNAQYMCDNMGYVYGGEICSS